VAELGLLAARLAARGGLWWSPRSAALAVEPGVRIGGRGVAGVAAPLARERRARRCARRRPGAGAAIRLGPEALHAGAGRGRGERVRHLKDKVDAVGLLRAGVAELGDKGGGGRTSPKAAAPTAPAPTPRSRRSNARSRASRRPPNNHTRPEAPARDRAPDAVRPVGRWRDCCSTAGASSSTGGCQHSLQSLARELSNYMRVANNRHPQSKCGQTGDDADRN
jgi:hypothetical protein